MAVSHLSRTFRADPYVLPVDLSLMSKVLGYKQSKFDENAKRIQSGINQLGNTDILRPQDKDYLTEKINGLVSQANDFGGVDLSDANISNQIESMGSGIYNDEKVINAISGTRSVMKLQESYEKYKTDPKFNKLYSVANEWADMQHVNAYMSQEGVGVAYNGPAAPTPYVPYRENLLKAIDKTKANYKEINGNLTITGQERISPERIMQEAADLLNENERAQLERDGLYGYRNASPEQVVNKALAINNFKLSSAMATLQDYKNGLLQSTSDPIAKQNYTTLIAQQEQVVKSLGDVSKNPDVLAKKYQENPSAFTVGVYKDEFYRGLAEKFAYTSTKQRLDPAAAFNLRMAQQERFHNDAIAMKQLELGYKILRDKNGNLVKGAAIDPQYTTQPPATAPTEQYEKGEEILKKENEAITDDNTRLFQNYLKKLIVSDPSLAQLSSSATSGTGVDVTFKGQELIENNNGVPGLQIDDLNVDLNDPKVKFAMQTVGITPQQAEFLKGVYEAYHVMATDPEKMAASNVKLPEGFEAFYNELQLNNGKIEANKSKMEGVNQTLARKFGLSPDDIKLFNAAENYAKKNAKFRDTFYSEVDKVNPVGGPDWMLGIFNKFQSALGDGPGDIPLTQEEMALNTPENFARVMKVRQTLENPEYKKERTKQWEAIENRPVFSRPVVDNKNNRTQKNLVASILTTQGDKNGEGQGAVFSEENVEIVDFGKSGDREKPYTVTARFKNPDPNKGLQQYELLLTPTQAKEFGIQESPYSRLDEEVYMSVRSTPKLISANLNRSIVGRKQPLRAKVAIYKVNPDSRTDYTSKAQLLDFDGNVIATIPNSEGVTPSEAYAKALAFIQEAENRGWDFKTMKQKAINDSY